MKPVTVIKAFAVLIGIIIFHSAGYAQDSTVTNILTTDEELWYMQPWVWIVGGVALLLILIALFSGGKKREKANSRTDKVIITKTVRTETDVDE